jgi:hypothetical protein
MRFADYFNFHPNASSVAFTDGVVTYGGLAGIVVNGNPGDVNYLGPGQMCFARVGDIACSILSNAHDIGNVQPTLPVNGVRPGSPIKDVENNAYNNVFGPSGPGDYAGSLAYDLPDLQPGASVSIRVLKGNVLPVQAGAPEPASFVLIGSALAAIGVRRRRRKNRSA